MQSCRCWGVKPGIRAHRSDDAKLDTNLTIINRNKSNLLIKQKRTSKIAIKCELNKKKKQISPQKEINILDQAKTTRYLDIKKDNTIHFVINMPSNN